MKAYIAIKYHADASNMDRIELISSILEQCGIGTVCIVRDVEMWGRIKLDGPTLMRRSFDEIDDCDVVIVDLTEKGVGVGIEAGYASARHIPIVTIAQEGSDISETLRAISSSVYLYRDRRDLLDFLKVTLEMVNR